MCIDISIVPEILEWTEMFRRMYLRDMGGSNRLSDDKSTMIGRSLVQIQAQNYSQDLQCAKETCQSGTCGSSIDVPSWGHCKFVTDVICCTNTLLDGHMTWLGLEIPVTWYPTCASNLLVLLGIST